MTTEFFVGFYDDQKRYWSMRFDTVEACLLFARFIALVREAAARAAGEADAIVGQELVGGAGQPIGAGDQVKVNYRMYLLSAELPRQVGTLLGTVGADKPKTVKVGDQKELTGIEHGLYGMKKGGSRCLIIPPAWGYGAAGVPPTIPVRAPSPPSRRPLHGGARRLIVFFVVVNLSI